MDCVRFQYVKELIVKPLDTFEQLRTTLCRLENLFGLYVEACDNLEQQTKLKAQLSEATADKDAAEKLLVGCKAGESSQPNNDFKSGYYCMKQPMKTENALQFCSWSNKAERTIIQLKKGIVFLENYLGGTERVESKLLARRMKSKSSLVELSSTMPQTFRLPTCLTYEEPKSKIRRISVGSKDLNLMLRPIKVIMMTGITGSGKTLMINAFVNYLYGVEFEDTFRFELVNKTQEKQESGMDSHSESMSMTSWVTGYELQWQSGFRFHESILLIDTPGFADPRGIFRDQEITHSIRQFFENEQACTVDKIASVAYIMKASSSKLTKEEKYCIDQVLSLFGADLKNNLTILFTYCGDEDNPPALECVKADKIPFIEYLSLNNQSVYGKPTAMNKILWEQNNNAMNRFFKTLEKIEVTDLHLTKEVLSERASLTLVLKDLLWKIKETLLMLQDMDACTAALLSVISNVRVSQEFHNLHFTYRAHRKVLETVSKYCMNCKKCQHTCCIGCKSLWNYWCCCFVLFDSVMKCRMCDGKCGESDHMKEFRMYKRISTPVNQTIESLLEKHHIPTKDPNAEIKLLCMMYDNYRSQKQTLFGKLLEATKIMHRLDSIALRNITESEKDYVTYILERDLAMGVAAGTDKQTEVEMLQQVQEAMRLANLLQICIQSKNCNVNSRSGSLNTKTSLDEEQLMADAMEIWWEKTGGYEQTIYNKILSIENSMFSEFNGERKSLLDWAKRALNRPLKTEKIGAFQFLERAIAESSIPADQSSSHEVCSSFDYKDDLTIN